ncbi:esterase [bacterium (Candidatus Blackallbacteria) CG17_big_fil_post_rev_8_21_14_2_50_48_46]|uniref:Esterase n=1 Tax=bacterium (Candidatus Blackallbacteria) CG17_big_fil_post_rev_8_21_14_2_50_48_46 TaxID=2014261 RepID=A0A2M7G2J8_9BACT|nr:MAG: esterase [bacterium (Candidatus Blackallbacteria) CG18_big_fil_WC_8_21_14_2_50_49_26]PIW15598.1 MAG: esterase [bacterium (Candidatus Blackallbacteria) CG17_big_fil_post_rev_8_21_14_2_50_48_46]PIW49389.1 MAG: esterase [bacterium (Candidatus Blackallbacteria) CG13_big_fil_rev_8_21_14_2_50_49_14]
MPSRPLFKQFLALLTLALVACQAVPNTLVSALPGSASRLLISSLPRLQVKGHTLTGTFKTHAQVASRFLKRSRNILVYLPPGYAAEPSRRYPVLYMHDGNNLFDRQTSFGGSEWEVDENMERMIRSGQIEPAIVVGIYNTPDRLDEYTWQAMDLDGEIQGGQGPNYARFIVEELKPLIDKTYRTLPQRENTAVMGSSLGGLISFYLGLHYPQVFSKIGMMSPSIWWKDRVLLQEVPKLSKKLKIWLDMGTREGQAPEIMLQDARDLAQALEKNGFEHFRNLAFHIEPNAGHNEQAWAARISHPLSFFYGSPASASLSTRTSR